MHSGEFTLEIRMASKPLKPPDAFLSYTHFDDRHDGGAISEFGRRLASAVQAVSGAPFQIFQDSGDIASVSTGQASWTRCSTTRDSSF
jgi:hypothetical protein